MDVFNNGSNLTTLKSSNKSLVLRVLNTLGQISRSELSRITGLTKTTITNIVNELIDLGLIYETGVANPSGTTSSGRRPVLLNLSKDALYSAGIYISRDFVYSCIINLKGEIKGEKRRNFEITEGESSFTSKVCECLQSAISLSKVDFNKIIGVGIASIGPLDIKNGIILDPPNFRGLKSIPIVSVINKMFNLPAFLDNDMNASAIAEKLFGNGKKYSNLIYVGITNGVGAGIIINNSIFRGSDGFGGEIGHTTVDIHGDICPCGNIGCLEIYASIPSVVRQVKSSVELGAASLISNNQSITWNDIVHAASNGDKLCLKAFEKLVYYLSIGLVNVINIFDPEIVFIGHEIAIAGDLIIQPLRDMVNKNILFRNSKNVKIEISSFREYAPCIGSGSIVLEKFFNGEIEK